MPVRPLARQRALRALAEGAKATLDLLADASGRSLRMLKREAEREGWHLDQSPLGDWAARMRAMNATLLDHLETVTQRAIEEGGKIDKAEIDAIVSMVRGMEKIGEFMRTEEVAKENKNDDELAEILDRIDTRIIELAQQLAKKMVEEEHRH